MAKNIETVFTAKTDQFEAGVRKAAGTLKTETGRMYDALKRAGEGIDGLDEANRRLVAAQSQATAEFRAAKTEYRQGVISIEQYRQKQLETRIALGQVKAEHSQLVNELRRGAGAVGSSRAGMQNLGFQLQDVAVQFAGGASAARIFALQGPQIVGAVQMMSNSTGKFASFMAGPWGAAVGVGVAVVGALATKLFDSSDAADKAKKSQETFAETLDRTKHSYDEVVAAIREYNAQQKKANEISIDNAAQAAKTAAANLQEAKSIREKIKAQIDAQIVNNQINAGQGSVPGTVSGAGGLRLLSLQQQLASQDAELKRLSDDARDAVVGVAEAISDINSDPVKRLHTGFDELRKQAKATITDVKELTTRLTELNRQEAAAVKAVQASERTAAKSIGQEQAKFILPVQGRQTGSFGESRPGHQHAGIDIAVPVGTPVKAPQTGTVIEAGTLPGYGNVVFIDHGGGTISRLAHLSKISVAKGQTVEQGGVIGLSGGAKGSPGAGDSTGPHLHYEVRSGGKAVNPLKGPFTVDSLGAADKAKDIAEREQRALQAAIEKAARQQREYADQSASLDGQLLDAKRVNITDAAQLAQIARDDVNVAADKLKADIEAKAVTNPIIQTHKDELEAVVDQVRQQRLIAIDTAESRRQAEEALRNQIAANDNERDLLSLQDSLAQTAAERRRIQMRILELERRDEEATLRKVIATSRDADERSRAQARLDALPGIYSARGSAVTQSTQGPLERYLAEMNPNLVGERVQGAVIDELESVRQGIDDALVSVIGVKDPFLSAIIDLFVQQVIIRPIAQALQSSMGSSGGGFLGTLIGAAGSLFGGGGVSINGVTGSQFASGLGSEVSGWVNSTSVSLAGARANGGPVDAGKAYLVGEKRPEIFVPHMPGFILPDVNMARNDNTKVVEPHFHFNGQMSERERRQTTTQAMRDLRAEMGRQARIG